MFVPSLQKNILKYKISNFLFYGITGFIVGLILGITLCQLTDLSLWILVLMSLLGAGAFFAQTYLHKIVTNEEDLVYYRHEIAILFVCAIMLWVLGQPVASYLDITLMGIGAFLVFGRWGCYHVGCCHGRPCKVGVLYSEEHARAGFPFYYVGVKIFPLPLVESFFVFITVIISSWIILQDSPPGTALIWYTVFYGSVRFILEFFRGDPERSYWKGFSEAQWTTLLLFLFTVALSYIGWLPFYTWHTFAVIGLILSMIVITFYRKKKLFPTYEIINPHHVWEIANGLKTLEKVTNSKDTTQKRPIAISCTSLGLNISTGKIPLEQGHMIHYTLSGTKSRKNKHDFPLNQKAAEVIGELIQTIQHRKEPFEIQAGQSNVYHILFKETNTRT